MENIQERFIQFIEQKHLLLPNEKVLLAVSGGVDSMLMLHLFMKSTYAFEVAHCNFELRGKESDADEKLLVDFTKKVGITLHVKHFNTPSFAKEKGLSIQLAARELRYTWLEELCKKRKLNKIATAHHLNDSIETFFINLNRGTGINGLKGIPVQNKNIIRPLSIFSRREIVTYAKKNKVSYREDRSNKDVKYLRNWFRNKVFPLWKERNPEFEKIMKSNLQLLSNQADLLNQYLESHLRTLEDELKSGSIEIKQLLQLPNPELILYELLNQYAFSFSDTKQLVELLKNPSSGKKILNNEYEILVDRKKIFIKKIASGDEKEYSIQNITDVAHLPIPLSIAKEKFKAKKQINPSSKVFQADRKKLQFPLKLRKWKAGDTFNPLGMKGSKKISDYLIDQKISLHQKEEVYVLLSADKIIWLVGFRADDRIKIDENTKEILEIILQ